MFGTCGDSVVVAGTDLSCLGLAWLDFESTDWGELGFDASEVGSGMAVSVIHRPQKRSRVSTPWSHLCLQLIGKCHLLDFGLRQQQRQRQQPPPPQQRPLYEVFHAVDLCQVVLAWLKMASSALGAAVVAPLQPPRQFDLLCEDAHAYALKEFRRALEPGAA